MILGGRLLLPRFCRAAMGQGTLDTFLGREPKRARTSASAARTTQAAAGKDAAEAAAAATGAAPSPAAAAGGSPPAAPLSPADKAALQVAETEKLRALGNRNQALAKQVVIAAEAAGAVPPLGDLLTEDSWRAALGGELSSPYWGALQAYVAGEWVGSAPVFPPKHAVFRALNACPPGAVRVVILGQDPYHDHGQAVGLSFSVPEGKAVPSSLRNMYKELREDLGCAPPGHGNLEAWAAQGVLLLNAVLTVRAHTPASHAKRGWERFTSEVISHLSREHQGIVFLLWGRYAQEKGKVIDRSRHHVLEAAHPSGLSASRGFFGCRHFSKANALLEADGKLPIDWCIQPLS